MTPCPPTTRLWQIRRVSHEREAAVPQLQERLKKRCAEVQQAWEGRIEGAFEGLLQEVRRCVGGWVVGSFIHPSPSNAPSPMHCIQALPPVAARALEAEDDARHFLQSVAPPLVHAATSEVGGHDGVSTRATAREGT